MNNHDRAKKIRRWVLEQEGRLGLRIDEMLEKALDATEPLTREKYERLFKKPEPKPRPAFIGDEVRMNHMDLSGFVVGKKAGDPRRAWVQYKGVSGVGGAITSNLTHPDGAPVSRIIEHRRPIPVSERLPTKEDANKFGSVQGLWRDGEWMTVQWDASAMGVYITHWLPCPESGVE